MNSLLLTYMNNGILVSVLVLLLFVIQKKLKKHLSNNCLYLCCIVLLLAYLIPFRPFAKNPLFTIMTPRVIKEEAEVIDHYDLTTSNLLVTNLDETSSSKATTKDSHNFIPVLKEVSKKYNNLFLLTVIWSLGIFITFGYHVVKHYLFCKTIKRITKPLDDQTKLELLHKKQEQLDVSDTVTCRICSSIGSPITVGLLHPIIILPSCTYTEEELNYILRHELVHIKRKDILLQWLLLICLSLHWYNPILYLFIHIWKDFCESSCDSIVLSQATTTERIEYSKVLLKTALHQNQVHQLLFINFNGGKRRMKNRLQSVLDTKHTIHKKTGILTIMALILIICSTSIFSIAKENTTTTTEPSTVIDQIVDSTKLSTVVTKEVTSFETSTKENAANFSLQDFVADVKTYEGAPYAWGGNTPETGFDTSGFTQYIYSLYGYNLPRTSKEQSNSLPVISRNELQSGDLVFYANDDNVICHVGIYLGDNQIIHASNPSEGVKISSVDYRPINSMGRVIQE